MIETNIVYLVSSSLDWTFSLNSITPEPTRRSAEYL
jgi:hypothetical protein